MYDIVYNHLKTPLWRLDPKHLSTLVLALYDSHEYMVQRYSELHDTWQASDNCLKPLGVYRCFPAAAYFRYQGATLEGATIRYLRYMNGRLVGATSREMSLCDQAYRFARDELDMADIGDTRALWALCSAEEYERDQRECARPALANLDDLRKHLPAWANWVAMNLDGRWKWFVNEPTIPTGSEFWHAQPEDKKIMGTFGVIPEKYQPVVTLNATHNWKRCKFSIREK